MFEEQHPKVLQPFCVLTDENTHEVRMNPGTPRHDS